MRRCVLALLLLLAGGLIFLAGLVTGAGSLQRLVDVKIFDGQKNAKWLLESAGSLAEGPGAGGPGAPGGGAAVEAAPPAASSQSANPPAPAPAAPPALPAPAAQPPAPAPAAPPALPAPAAQPPAPAPAAPPAPPALAAQPPAPAGGGSGRTAKYGFYLHVFNDPAAVIHQVRQVQKHFPGSPIYIMSDGGSDFSGLCKQEGCTFKLCPPANDRWHPWPFFRRLYDAAVSLNVEYVIMLEPDNTVHGPIKRHPTHDAGGLYVRDRSFGLGDYVEKLASKHKPGFKWTRLSMQAGLAGGSYFKTEAIIDAFSDESMSEIDWNYVGEAASKEIFSSDFAMQYALAARGWSIHPWEETAQMDKKKDEPLTGPKDAAFRHYCSCYPGGKPTYNLRLQPEDQHLVKPAPSKFNPNYVCQLCYNLSRYVHLWGSADCTNRLPFKYSDLLMQRHHPELKGGCELTWLCEPRKR